MLVLCATYKYNATEGSPLGAGGGEANAVSFIPQKSNVGPYLVLENKQKTERIVFFH